MSVQAQTPAEIDAVKSMTTKIVETDDDDNFVTKDMQVIGVPVRMMVDMMCFTGASRYGHKSMLESVRTNQAFRQAFQVFSQQIAADRGDEFWASWKDFRLRNPVADRPAAAAATGPVSLMTLHADSDDEASPGGGGGGGGAAEGAGAAQAPRPPGGNPD